MAIMDLRPDEIRDDPDLAEHLRTYEHFKTLFFWGAIALPFLFLGVRPRRTSSSATSGASRASPPERSGGPARPRHPALSACVAKASSSPCGLTTTL